MIQQQNDVGINNQNSLAMNCQDPLSNVMHADDTVNIHDAHTIRNILSELISQNQQPGKVLDTNDLKSYQEKHYQPKHTMNALVVLAPNQYIDIINNIKAQFSHEFTKINVNSRMEVFTLSNLNHSQKRIKSEEIKGSEQKIKKKGEEILFHAEQQNSGKIQSKVQNFKDQQKVCQSAFSAPSTEKAGALTEAQTESKVEQKVDQKYLGVLSKDDKKLLVNQQNRILQQQSVVEENSSFDVRSNPCQKSILDDEEDNQLDNAFCQQNGNNQSGQEQGEIQDGMISREIQEVNNEEDAEIKNKHEECNEQNKCKSEDRCNEQLGKQIIQVEKKQQLQQHPKQNYAIKEQLNTPKIGKQKQNEHEFKQLSKKELSKADSKLNKDRAIVQRRFYWINHYTVDEISQQPLKSDAQKQKSQNKPSITSKALLSEKCLQQLTRLSTAQTQLSYLCQQMKYDIKIRVENSQVPDMYKCMCTVRVEGNGHAKTYTGSCQSETSKKLARHEAALFCLANMYSSIDYLWQKYEMIKQQKPCLKLKQKEDNSAILNKWLESVTNPQTQVRKVVLGYDKEVKYENKRIANQYQEQINNYIKKLKSCSRELILFIDQNNKTFNRPRFRFYPKDCHRYFTVEGYVRYELWDASKNKYNVYQISHKVKALSKYQCVQALCKLFLQQIYKDFYGRYKKFIQKKREKGLQ